MVAACLSYMFYEIPSKRSKSSNEISASAHHNIAKAADVTWRKLAAKKIIPLLGE